YNCKEYGHVARECQKPKRAKDAAYHQKKMLLCKQEEARIQLNAEQADWKDDTNDEYDDQELEAHYIEQIDQNDEAVDLAKECQHKGCYNDNLGLMLSPESDEVIRLEKESRSKLSDLVRPFDYAKLNSLYDLFVPQHSEQRTHEFIHVYLASASVYVWIGEYTRRTRIAQSSVLLPVAYKPASSLGGVSQGEACLTDSCFKADQDRANIAKTSTLPSDSTPRVTSLAADEGSMQQKLDELTDLCTSLQRQHSEMVSRFEAQELEINSLKARIKLLEDKDRGVAEQSGDDAPIKGRRLDEREEAAERVSDDTEEMATVLTFMDAASILTSGGVQVVPTAAEVATATVSIPTGSGMVSTASPTIPIAALIFTTATESTPYTRRKVKEKMVESDTPKKKKLQEQIDVQVDRVMH
nr:hypothetical protein [Tanacetum cinerariifolium]